MKKINLLCPIAFLLLSISVESQIDPRDLIKAANNQKNTTISIKDAVNMVWETGGNHAIKMNSSTYIDPIKIPDSYTFDWKYAINIKTQNDEMDIVYRIKEGANYVGMEDPNISNMLALIDNEKKMFILYRDGDVSAFKLQEEIKGKSPYADLKYKKIGSKSILGYKCEGFQAETDEYVLTRYVTKDAIGFNIMYGNQKNSGNAKEPDWKNKKYVLMQMQADHKKNPSKSMIMTCTQIEKEDFTIAK